MTFWEWVLVALCAVWVFMLAMGLIGAGLPLLREKIRRKRRTGNE